MSSVVKSKYCAISDFLLKGDILKDELLVTRFFLFV
jgi:hypothetical protein